VNISSKSKSQRIAHFQREKILEFKHQEITISSRYEVYDEIKSRKVLEMLIIT
jgi:hypothetical protein